MKLLRAVLNILLSGMPLFIQGAQEAERGQHLSPAAFQELKAVDHDLRALINQELRTNREVCANMVAASKKELDELEQRLAAEGKSEKEMGEMGEAFSEAFLQTGRAHLAQHAVELDNKIKELLAERAPTLLAEDPDLQKIFSRK